MCIGIIGLPYAFNRAGLFLGFLLLFSLTGVVDWTIRYDRRGYWVGVDGRLIVVNAKLSGSSSYQDTVASCFGHAGLVPSIMSICLILDRGISSTVLFRSRRNGLFLRHNRYTPFTPQLAELTRIIR